MNRTTLWLALAVIAFAVWLHDQAAKYVKLPMRRERTPLITEKDESLD